MLDALLHILDDAAVPGGGLVPGRVIRLGPHARRADVVLRIDGRRNPHIARQIDLRGDAHRMAIVEKRREIVQTIQVGPFLNRLACDRPRGGRGQGVGNQHEEIDEIDVQRVDRLAQVRAHGFATILVVQQPGKVRLPVRTPWIEMHATELRRLRGGCSCHGRQGEREQSSVTQERSAMAGSHTQEASADYELMTNESYRGGNSMNKKSHVTTAAGSKTSAGPSLSAAGKPAQSKQRQASALHM